MALKLSTTLPSGVIAEYWRIDSFTPRRIANTTTVTLGLYLNHDAAVAGDAPVDSNYHFTFSGDLNPCTNSAMDKGSPVALLYSALKSNPADSKGTDLSQFSQAEDE